MKKPLCDTVAKVFGFNRPSTEFAPQRQNPKPTYIILQAAPQNVKPSYNAPARQNTRPTYYAPAQSSQFVAGLPPIDNTNPILEAAKGLVNLKKNLIRPLLAPLIDGGGASTAASQQVRPSYGAPQTALQVGYGAPLAAPQTDYGAPLAAPQTDYGAFDV